MKNRNSQSKLSKFGRELLSKESLEDGLVYISEYAKNNFAADRCSIFIYDPENYKLWTPLADGVDKIVISSDLGLVGQTLRTKKPVIENNAYENVNFLPDIDMQTGYYTQNIAAVPIFDSQREAVGVLELLNKEEGFNNNDIKFLTFFSHYISGFLELIDIYK